jgi:hypothetical protein
MISFALGAYDRLRVSTRSALEHPTDHAYSGLRPANRCLDRSPCQRERSESDAGPGVDRVRQHHGRRTHIEQFEPSLPACVLLTSSIRAFELEPASNGLPHKAWTMTGPMRTVASGHEDFGDVAPGLPPPLVIGDV